MELELRPIVADELAAFRRADEYGFGHRHEHPEHIQGWTEAELDRTVAAFEGDEIVGIGRNYSLELTLPGGAIIPVAGVSWIAVRPTHRRRGILRRIMAYLVEEGARRGECASILTASEGAIYGRFGFGVASEVLSIELRHDAVTFAQPVTDGRVRMIEPDEATKIAPELFERVRAQRNGAVSRTPVWWAEQWVPHEEAKKRFDVVYERDGRVDGYAVYNIEGTWTNGFNDKTVEGRGPGCRDAGRRGRALAVPVQHRPHQPHGARPRAGRHRAAVAADGQPADARERTRRLALAATGRRARAPERPARTRPRRSLVLEVRDEMRPDGDAAGRFLLEGGPDAASCDRTDAQPDLVLDVGALGSLDPRVDRRVDAGPGRAGRGADRRARSASPTACSPPTGSRTTSPGSNPDVGQPEAVRLPRHGRCVELLWAACCSRSSRPEPGSSMRRPR